MTKFVDNPYKEVLDYLKNLPGIDNKAISKAQGGFGRWSTPGHNNNDCWARLFEAQDIYTVVHGSFISNEKEIVCFVSSQYENDSTAEEKVKLAINKAVEESNNMLSKERENTLLSIQQYIATLFEAKTHETDKVFPYLENKGITSNHGSYVDLSKEQLIVPLYNESGIVTSYQSITAGGEKKLAYNGTKKGSFFTIGSLKTKGPIYVAEGFATACSIHEATGETTICAVDCNNLLPVVENLVHHKITPIKAGRITIVADNDDNRTGETHALEVKNKVGCNFVLIPRTEDEKSGFDANDFSQKYGNEALKSLLKVKKKIVGIDEFCRSYQPTTWLVKGLIPAGPSTGMIYGAGGSRKTFLILDLALHVAFNMGHWLGLNIKQQSVLYLCAEGIPNVMQRVIAWCQYHNKSIDNMGEYAKFLQYPDDLYIDDNKGLEKLIAEVPENFKPGLIVIDTLAQFFVGDENKQEDSIAFTRGVGKLSRMYNATVIFIHHTNKADNYRGSTVLKGNVDFIYPVTVLDNKNVSQLGGTGDEKLRAGIVPPPLCFQIEDITLENCLDEEGNPATEGVVVSTDVAPTTVEGKEKSKKNKDVKPVDLEKLKSIIKERVTELTTIGIDKVLFVSKEDIREYAKKHSEELNEKKDPYTSAGSFVSRFINAGAMTTHKDNFRDGYIVNQNHKDMKGLSMLPLVNKVANRSKTQEQQEDEDGSTIIDFAD
ncbi:MAG: AAA family ATPase [Sphaerochaetaceae bacterium]|nr:AAA family ATPase [Sphaerochaetaceae bacterium]